MKSIFTVTYYDSIGDRYERNIMCNRPDVYTKEFERDISKATKTANTFDLVSKSAIMDKVIELLKVNNKYEEVNICCTQYCAEDRCPVPNTTYITKRKYDWMDL